ncbi:MAG TPA: phosphonoacetaldehyde hydrolase [Bryobacteraceae bacterium]|jgi:phosphonoacetaldehyde hydrolase|nr:phosphonoacetaldehyde hydrolase [Bryobacteraceae bacterium]
MTLPASNVPRSPIASKIQAVIFDWAGTTVDFGSLAPVRTIQRVFEEFDLPVYESEARQDMGLPKRDHIARILSIPRIQTAWDLLYGALPVQADIDRLYARFVPLQFDCLCAYSSVIEGVSEMVEKLRRRGLRIGSTTGYTRAMLDLLVEQSAREGFTPDCSLSPEDVGAGRPHPFMIFETAVRLKIYPLAAIVKVGDTVADVQEGLNAGVWSVGVVKTGNMIGLRKADLDVLPANDLGRRLSLARAEFEKAGAHYVIDTLDELESVIDEIDVRLDAAVIRW